MECASAEVSVPPELKSIGRFGPFHLADPLLDALQINSARCFQDLPFIGLIDFDFVLLRPIPEVRDVRAITKVRSKTATPPDKLLRLQIRLRGRRIEQ